MQELLYEERDRTAFLTLNRPQVRNCLSMKLSDELIGAIERVRASETLRFLVIRGAGETFCVGDDIMEMPSWGNANEHVSATSKEKTSSHALIRRTKRKVRNHMVCYRIALRGNHSAIWRWKSPPFTSLHGVLGMLSLYRTLPEEHIRVFLFTSTQQMGAMLQRANQGVLSTAIAVKELWDAHHTSWMEVKRVEIEVGEGGDHDQPYDGHLIASSSQELAWTRLLARRARGELLP